MIYKTLATKWRPRTLDDVIGQEESIYIIKNIINTKSIHHAYLISGSQGIGKTSLARIITKCINCEIKITTKPCNICYCCKNINEGKNIDSIEVDAASKTKVEDIKDLIELSRYKNLYNRFKTYIIDECHMLSINSFNSLLKVLEEHQKAIYIFVTTHLEKIPETIISRCIHLKLKRITNYNIEKRLKYILRHEKINFHEEALSQLSLFCNGSMRQALNILEKVKTNNMTGESVKYLLGTTSEEQILSIMFDIIKKNYKNIIKQSKTLIEKNHNLENILTQLQIILYKISLYKIKINYDKKISKNKLFLYLSNVLTHKKIQTIYHLISKEKSLIRFSPNECIGFEMILVKILINI